MQAGQLIIVRTDPTTQFTGALAQNAAATLDMTMNGAGQSPGNGYLDGSLGGGRTVRARLRSLFLQSVENLAWEVWLWGKDTYNASLTNPASNYPLGRWAFGTGDAVRIAGTGLYYYYIDGLDQVYVDLDSTSELHVMLVNRSAAAKTAGSGGYILVQFHFEPTLGW